jgi:uncharacterized membrane protein YgcG
MHPQALRRGTLNRRHVPGVRLGGGGDNEVCRHSSRSERRRPQARSLADAPIDFQERVRKQSHAERPLRSQKANSRVAPVEELINACLHACALSRHPELTHSCAGLPSREIASCASSYAYPAARAVWLMAKRRRPDEGAIPEGAGGGVGCMLTAAQAALHASSAPVPGEGSSLACRDAETGVVRSFLQGCLAHQRVGSLHISGAPGVGKTAVVVSGVEGARRRWSGGECGLDCVPRGPCGMAPRPQRVRLRRVRSSHSRARVLAFALSRYRVLLAVHLPLAPRRVASVAGRVTGVPAGTRQQRLSTQLRRAVLLVTGGGGGGGVRRLCRGPQHGLQRLRSARPPASCLSGCLWHAGAAHAACTAPPHPPPPPWCPDGRFVELGAVGDRARAAAARVRRSERPRAGARDGVGAQRTRRGDGAGGGRSGSGQGRRSGGGSRGGRPRGYIQRRRSCDIWRRRWRWRRRRRRQAVAAGASCALDPRPHRHCARQARGDRRVGQLAAAVHCGAFHSLQSALATNLRVRPPAAAVIAFSGGSQTRRAATRHRWRDATSRGHSRAPV